MVDYATETTQRKPEYIELREKALLDAIFGEYDPSTGFTGGMIQDPSMFLIPEYRLAGQQGRAATGEITGFGPETYGMQYVQQDLNNDGIPDFVQRTDPYFTQAQTGIGAGLGALGDAATLISDPTSVTRFMNPFTDAVIREAERDIERQGQQEMNRAAGQAVRAGAFGGSRQGIQAAEVQKNIMDAKQKASTDLRLKNYQQALSASQEAGRLLGGLGQSYGTMAGQSADVGRVYGAMAPADLAFMSGVGESDRAFRQQQIDTARQEAMRGTEQALLPYNYAYGALTGTPSAGVYNQVQQPIYQQSNPLMAGLGAYTTMQGINAA